MTAEKHITPRVLAHLRGALPDIEVPIRRRASFERCQLVLRQLCRWARRVDPDDAGRWHSNDSVAQLALGTGLTESTVRAALTCLEHVGLAVRVRRGGGPGAYARGSVRLLCLDPVDNSGTPRANPAEFRPELRGVERELRGVETRTPRGQARDSVLTSVVTSARDDESVDNVPVPVPAAVKDLLRPFARIGGRL